MSEEFSISVSFSMKSADEMAALEECLEHLDMEESDEAQEMMAARALQSAQEQQVALTIDGSNYDSTSDIATMYIGTYNDSVKDHELTVDADGVRATYYAEGVDHDAPDFCTSVILLLVAMGATDIKGSASSSFWFARWIEGENHRVAVTFETEE